jgi:hypothetical protein
MRRKLTSGKIIKEKEWFRALHNEIVNAHRHQINADGVVNACFNRDVY